MTTLLSPYSADHAAQDLIKRGVLSAEEVQALSEVESKAVQEFTESTDFSDVSTEDLIGWLTHEEIEYFENLHMMPKYMAAAEGRGMGGYFENKAVTRTAKKKQRGKMEQILKWAKRKEKNPVFIELEKRFKENVGEMFGIKRTWFIAVRLKMLDEIRREIEGGEELMVGESDEVSSITKTPRHEDKRGYYSEMRQIINDIQKVAGHDAPVKVANADGSKIQAQQINIANISIEEAQSALRDMLMT